jgi:hypothetical protein
VPPAKLGTKGKLRMSLKSNYEREDGWLGIAVQNFEKYVESHHVLPHFKR